MGRSAKSNPRVLVIDDDAVMRDILSLVLEAEGCVALTCESGDAALRTLGSLQQDEMPAIVLTDLQMPGLIGAALAAQLRAACPGFTALIAMSGSTPKGTDAKAFDAFLLKPFTAEDVVATVARHTRQGTAEPDHAEAPESASLLNEDIYAKLASTMPDAQLRELYRMCLDDATERINSMRAASIAQDSATFIREAHAIKGGCGMLGATQLYGLAAAMETGALACTPLLDEFPVAAERLRRMLEARS